MWYPNTNNFKIKFIECFLKALHKICDDILKEQINLIQAPIYVQLLSHLYIGSVGYPVNISGQRCRRWSHGSMGGVRGLISRWRHQNGGRLSLLFLFSSQPSPTHQTSSEYVHSISSWTNTNGLITEQIWWLASNWSVLEEYHIRFYVRPSESTLWIWFRNYLCLVLAKLNFI